MKKFHFQFTALITTHNHLEMTKRCVGSLRKYSPFARIVLADDNSEDGTREWARSEKLQVIQFRGQSLGGNLRNAIDQMRYDQSFWGLPLANFDNDVEVTPGWFAPLQKILESDHKIGIVAPMKLLGNRELQNIGNTIDDRGISYYNKKSGSIIEVDYVETACMITRDSVWPKIKWDPNFKQFYNDVDACFQVRQMGYRVVASSSAVVYHHAHTTSDAYKRVVNDDMTYFKKKWGMP